MLAHEFASSCEFPPDYTVLVLHDSRKSPSPNFSLHCREHKSRTCSTDDEKSVSALLFHNFLTYVIHGVSGSVID
jgi:hypothetical protein